MYLGGKLHAHHTLAGVLLYLYITLDTRLFSYLVMPDVVSLTSRWLLFSDYGDSGYLLCIRHFAFPTTENPGFH